ncbi:SDR family oxidoreductase [Corynebacterium sp. YIM 101645]|uniref:SDR family oxidoreductase n=1 Tax=Corynebacterium lemuris TaxID=1859292 RepID=A0ABT2G080_9CORY|nr:SDR family oxidoreductase [Corynebacterium lemuris]MCS5480906.1 SDR family oxidoreductase [Corynebacterium lemuris]
MTENTQKIAVVTGAAGGLGSFITRRLHADGHKVVVTGLSLDKLEQLASELSPDGSTAMPLQLDVSHKDNFSNALDRVTDVWGTPSILVNNAAVTKAANLLELNTEDFDEVLTTNVNSIFFGCQVFGAAMVDQGYGRIVNQASLAGQNGGTATGAHYAASKGAILTTTKIFAREFAGSGVTVNAISPGPHDVDIVHNTVADRLDQVVQSIPVKQLGNPKFIASTVSLLTQPEASFVTGACWDINGGLYLR